MEKTKKNKPAKVGRPQKFDKKEQIQKIIDDYFNKCAERKTKVLTKAGLIVELDDPLIPTMAGLAYELGMSRDTLYQYAEKNEFSDTIKKARNYIISQWESKLANTNSNAGGIIFLAKNYGYKDKSDDDNGDNSVKVLEIRFV